MPRSLTQIAMAGAAKQAGVHCLVAAGFKRNGGHFHRLKGGLVHAVRFQASQWGTAAEGSFTVNLVITSASLYHFWAGKPLPTNPATASFPISERIGHLMAPRCDHWWTVDAATDVIAMGHEVAHVLATLGLPFFDQYPSSAALLETLRTTGRVAGMPAGIAPLVRAMLAAEGGMNEEAAEIIAAEMARAGDSAFRATVESVAERLRVGLPMGRRAGEQ